MCATSRRASLTGGARRVSFTTSLKICTETSSRLILLAAAEPSTKYCQSESLVFRPMTFFFARAPAATSVGNFGAGVSGFNLLLLPPSLSSLFDFRLAVVPDPSTWRSILRAASPTPILPISLFRDSGGQQSRHLPLDQKDPPKAPSSPIQHVNFGRRARCRHWASTTHSARLRAHTRRSARGTESECLSS